MIDYEPYDRLRNIETVACQSIYAFSEIVKKEKAFSFLQTNIRGVKTNVDNFCLDLNDILVTLDHLILSETGHEGISLPGVSIPGFSVNFSEKLTNKCGGVIVFVSNKITVVGVREYDLEGASCLIVECILNKKLLNFICIYRSPSGDLKVFIDNLRLLLSSLNLGVFKILLGDININIKVALSREVDSYLNLLHEYKLCPYINIPTRVTLTGSETCIDHVFGNVHNQWSVVPVVLETTITDHYTTE